MAVWATADWVVVGSVARRPRPQDSYFAIPGVRRKNATRLGGSLALALVLFLEVEGPKSTPHVLHIG